MFKIIAPGSYAFDEPQVQLIKRARAGLRGHDLSELVKRAGHELVRALDRVTLAPDEVPVHLIALGSTESTGPNRNGDGFKAATCRKYHDTFVKHARWYRNHLNRDPHKSYGRVIASCFNEPMGRIELIAGLNGSEKTAAVNGGMVADKELARLNASKDLAVSMSTHVPYDSCSGCQNQARTRAEYCDGPQCKYGGLRHNIARTFADGHTLHADNPVVCWRDISDVSDTRPADRIAYVFGKLDKAASGQVLSGAELAELVGIDLPPLLSADAPEKIRRQVKVAQLLAGFEKAGDGLGTGWSNALINPLQETSWPAMTRTIDQAEVFRALAHEKVALSLRDFLALTLEDTQKAAAVAALVAPHVPGVYTQLVQEGMEEAAERNPFTVTPGPVSQAMASWAHKVAASQSLDKKACADRVMTAAVSPRFNNVIELRPLRKQASTHVNQAAAALARQYALYKIAALAACPEADQDWLARMAVRQDLVAATL